jgi:hypothetical protein
MTDSFFSKEDGADISADIVEVTPDVPVDTPDTIEPEIPQEPDVKVPLKDNKSYLNKMTDADVELQAKQIGWNPKGVKSAKEYLEASQKRAIDSNFVIESMAKKIDQIQEQTQKQIEADRQKVIAEAQAVINHLKLRRAEATEEGDNVKVEALVDAEMKARQNIQQLEQQAESEKNNKAQAEIVQFERHIQNDFMPNNPWYNKNERLTHEFDKTFKEYINDGVNAFKALQFAQEAFLERHPSLGKPQAQTKQPPVGDALSAVPSVERGTGLTSEQTQDLKSHLQTARDMGFSDAQLKDFEKSYINQIKGAK